MENQRTFGGYLREKRLEKGMTLRALSEELHVSIPYMCDVENNRRNPLEKVKLARAVEVLKLSDEEQQVLYDLAGRERSIVSPDLEKYIMNTDEVRMALRAARDADLSGEDWLRITEMIQNIRKRE